MPESKLIDANVAANRLGVKHATLYSYVSRGMIRTTSTPGAPRRRLYFASDVALLEKRKESRRPSRAVAGALDFGLPVLETRITSIEAGVLRYRGVNAVELAREASFEEAAKLLWDQGDDAPTPSFRFRPPPGSNWLRASASESEELATDRALTLLPSLLKFDDSVVRRGKVPEICAGLVGAVAVAVVGGEISGQRLHAWLADRWNAPAAADALRCALVLCADHELNASTFAVRVVASTGAGLTASVIAGLAALRGPRHGGMTMRVERLFDDIGTPSQARRVISERLRLGERVPGFDHPLYPDGDPRAQALLAYCGRDPLLRAVCKAAFSVGGLLPTVDIGLVGIERTFGLPRGSALALFAIARTVGWIAHAVEQRTLPQLIRPRAKYVRGVV